MAVESLAQTVAPSRGIGRILDLAVFAYRRKFPTLIAIAAAVQIPLILLTVLFPVLGLGLGPGTYPSIGLLLGWSTGVILSTILGFFLTNGLTAAALTRAVADLYLGRSPSFGGTYRQIGPFLGRILAMIALALLLWFLLLFWAMIPCIGWFTGMGAFFFFGSLVLPVAIPVLILEQQTPRRALRRSWDLLRRRFWWVVGFGLSLSFFQQFLITGPSYLFSMLILDLGAVWGSEMLVRSVVSGVVGGVLSLFYLPLQQAAITLLYFDLRMRTEGFDLLCLAREEPAADLLPQVPRSRPVPLIQGRELGYFAAISGGMGLLIGLLWGGLVALAYALF